MSTIEERVKKIVCEQLQLSQAPEEIANDANFLSDLGADSLDTVELVMALEDEFDVNIADEVAETIRTVQDAITHIEAEQA